MSLYQNVFADLILFFICCLSMFDFSRCFVWSSFISFNSYPVKAFTLCFKFITFQTCVLFWSLKFNVEFIVKHMFINSQTYWSFIFCQRSLYNFYILWRFNFEFRNKILWCCIAPAIVQNISREWVDMVEYFLLFSPLILFKPPLFPLSNLLFYLFLFI